MRCVNCGWDNPDGITVCTKCGQPLGGNNYSSPSSDYAPASSSPSDSAQRATVIGAAQLSGGERATVIGTQDSVSRPTVIGSADNNQRATVIDTHTTSEARDDFSSDTKSKNICPSCGYPILDTNVTTCPSCGYKIKKNQRTSDNTVSSIHAEGQEDSSLVKCQQCGYMVPDNYRFCPSCGGKVHRATHWKGFRHFVKEEPKKEFPFSLTIIPEEDEKIEAKELSFNCIEDETVVLNRDNTDCDNRSITSGKQAEIGYEDGHWYLNNLSENESTFILANRKTELKDGDIIVLGYRYFRFSSK